MLFTTRIAACELRCEAMRMGNDCLIALSGGDAPHIGCAVMAIPRPSLTGQGRSATTSTLNRLGHKDDVVATRIAEQVAARLDCVVVCACGIHIDGADTDAIAAVTQAVDEIADKVCAGLDTTSAAQDEGSEA